MAKSTAKSLVIVESPAKARTINRYLGDDYLVKSSVGHIRDLPVSQKGKKKPATRGGSPAERQLRKQRQLIERIGVDPDKNWQANYEILPNKKDIVAELKQLARRFDHIVLATDMDREGEAIAWHLREAIGGDTERYQRVVFNEITQQAIQEAFAHPQALDMAKVNAQQTRRFLDRIFGFMLSPLLWQKIARGLSAGRVQSVAVRLVAERERAIRAFTPEEYWELFAYLASEGAHTADQLSRDQAFKWEVYQYQGQRFRPGNAADTQRALEAIKNHSDFVIHQKQSKQTKTSPKPPFITSTLQQAASIRLKLSVKRTMTLAQKLYEAGHITYMRTDSTHIGQEAMQSVRSLIGKSFGPEFLPDKPRFYRTKKQAQEAHEAIRPTDVRVRPESLSRIDQNMARLYDLIWRQFVASQMTDAIYDTAELLLAAGDYTLRIRGRQIRFAGYTHILPPTGQQDALQVLPDLSEGDRLQLVDLEPIQHFTKPPARFSEANLVKELEKRGIGRPSTYAAIISTIQERGYVSLHKKRFYIEKIGELVTDRLLDSFEDLMNYDFTADLELQLDCIASGERPWLEVLDSFYADFSSKLTQAESEEGGMRRNMPTKTDIQCPQCKRTMVVRTGATGVFLGCEGYNLPVKERCTQTIDLIPDQEFADLEKDDEAESRLLRKKRQCDQCESKMDSFLLDQHRKLHICSRNPDCAGFTMETGQFQYASQDGPELECDKCQSPMHLTSGRFGQYFKCSRSECKNTRKLMRNGEPAPPKMTPIEMPELRCKKVDDYYVLRDGLAGLFLAAKQFPKHRETRPVTVPELLSHQNELDPKYAFLTQAPTQDAEDRPAIVKFSRKTSEHYLMTEINGKPSGWEAHHRDGQWHEQSKPKKSRPARRRKA